MTEQLVEQTLVLIKPDGVYRGLIGEVLHRFERAGLKIVGMKMIWIDKDFSKKHYNEHLKKSFYPGLENYITAGPVVAMVIEGVSAVSVIRKMAGPFEPSQAIPGTIRGDYCHINAQKADADKKSVCNIIHASATPKEAVDEILLWFDPPELLSYKRSGEKWMQ